MASYVDDLKAQVEAKRRAQHEQMLQERAEKLMAEAEALDGSLGDEVGEGK